MKLLAFTDTHIHNWRNFGVDGTTGLSKRLLDQQKILSQIVNLAKTEKVDGLLFIGDLFHAVGTIPTECLNTVDVFFKALEALKLPVYLVKGNHDKKRKLLHKIKEMAKKLVI